MIKTIFISFFIVSISWAQWSASPDTNLLVSNIPGSNVYSPSVVTDGFNGAIVSWLDTRKGTTSIFAQRVSEDGLLQWGSSDVEITTDSSQILDYSIMSDGQGGAFLVWSHKGNVWYDIYAQRIDASGQRVWGDTGIVVCDAAFSQQQVQLVSDENGGFIVCWIDYRTSTYADIHAQRITQGGIALWPSNGVRLHTGRLQEDAPEIIGDGFGGAIVSWRSWAFSVEYNYAQRLNSNGNLIWSPDGVRVSDYDGDYSRTFLATDGAGGAIMAWHRKNILGYDNIFAQKIDSSGIRAWSDTSDIVINDAANGHHNTISMISDGSDGVYLAWADGRGTGNADIYMQHINNDSTASWTQNGILISDQQSYIPTPLLSAAPNNTVYIAWEDVRNSSNYLWGQRINPDSTKQWQANGVEFATGVYNYTEQKIHTTEAGNMIAVFKDPTQSQVHAKRIFSDGTLGVSTSIDDSKTIIIDDFTLYQNYPNPFNPETTINYNLNKPAFVNLNVYDITGRKIKTLVKEYQKTNKYSYKLNANDLAGGVYYYKLQLGNDYSETKKMILIK